LPAGAETVPVQDEASLSLVREAIRRVAIAAGLPAERFEALVTAASELGHNQLRHGFRGSMAVRPIQRGGVAGVEVVAIDQGRGIDDPSAALRGQPRPMGARGSMGVGLSAAYRLCDEMDFDVRLGEGTYVAARKFAAPLPRTEVAVLGRPIAGESQSGDDAAFARNENELLVAIADGLGHGPEAREASSRAMTAIRDQPRAELTALLNACHVALRDTRGAVVAAARFDRTASVVSHAGGGNISTHLYRGKSTRRFASVSCVVGARGPAPRFKVESEALEPRALLVMFSDGLSSRADLTGELELLREPPLVIAHQLMLRHGRTTDDALVLVAC
jgi:anti-sigma regulatory factor (Ser/Thr protein kinase)